MQKKISHILQNPRTLFISTLVLTVLLQTQGYCDNLEEANTQVRNILFGPGIRKAALTLGLGAGLFQAFMSGSIRPLLIFGGLGLAVCYLPAIIDMISGINV